MKRTRNGSRIMWIERPLWQETMLKTQRQPVCKSLKIWEMLKKRDQHPESLKQHLTRCCTLSETVWGILPVPMMKRIAKARQMPNKIQSWAAWAKMANLVGRWVVLGMGQGIPPAVRVGTGKTVQFGSGTVQKPDPLLPGSPCPAQHPSTHGFRRVWLYPSGPISGFAFWVVLFM